MSDIFTQFEKVKRAVKEFADDNDFCIVCQNHPSSGHSKDCPLYIEPNPMTTHEGGEK
jgi:hypothetical protein